MKLIVSRLFLLHVALAISQVACRQSADPGTAVTSPVAITDTGTTFRNPLLSVAPDPWVVFDNGFYYFMHTTGGDLRIYKTAKMSSLGSSTYKSVWMPPSAGPATRDLWAPELTRINGRWYIYYAAVVAPDTQHRMWVLENEAADPLTGTWTLRGQVKLPDNRWAIDGTSIVLNGQQYFSWSGWEGNENGVQNIYLCRMKDPWTADGPRVLLSTPVFDWERQGSPLVNEGPEFLLHNNKLFLIYSASFCGTDAYALGQLTTNSTADLTNPVSWTKSATPVFGPYAADGTYGVGHNGFFQTPARPGVAAQDWLVYHANPQAGQGCGDRRSTRMQPFGWKPDGSPDFGKPLPLTAVLKRPVGE